MVSKEAEQKIGQLQVMEQNLQQFLMQRQTFQSQINEVTSALSELEKTDQSYKIIGNVMVQMDKDALKKQLEEKKETAQLRITSIEKQEEKVKSKMKDMQAEIMQEMKNDG